MAKKPSAKSGRPRLHEESWYVSRNQRLIFFRELGHSYTMLGLRYGITRQRVGHILKALRPDLLGRPPRPRPAGEEEPQPGQ